MSEDKSKLQLIGEIAQANNKNLELIEELNDREEIERLNNIIKKVEECIDHYAIENEDFSKFYNNEEIEILKIIGSDKE